MGGWSCVGAMAVLLTALFMHGAAGKGGLFWRLYCCRPTPRLCGGVDGPEMYELSSSCIMCVDGLMKGDDVSVLIGQMCCLLHLYLQPWATMK